MGVRSAWARHRARHTPTELGFLLSDRIDYLDAARWDPLAASRGVLMSRPYLRLVETDGPRTIEPRYAMIFRGDKAVAALVAQQVTISGKRLVPKARNPGLLQRAARKATEASLAGLEERLLLCGNLLSWGPFGIAMAPDEDPTAIWPGVAEALYRLRRADRLSGDSDFVMVKDLPGQNQDAEALRTYSYRPLETEPNMVLALDPAWRTFDDYLGGLNKKYRKTAKEIVDKVAAGGVTMEPLEDVSAKADEIHALYLQVHERAAFRVNTLEPGFIPGLQRAFGERFRCTIARRGDKLVGFITTLGDGDTAIGYFVGFDSATNGEVPIYFRLLYQAVGDAISLGAKRLSLGRTALEPKARLGARPEPLSCWVRHRVPAMNLIVRALLHANEPDDAPERNPFK